MGQWNDLIPTLVENVVNEQSSELKKEASLEAIGRFRKFLDFYSVKVFLPSINEEHFGPKSIHIFSYIMLLLLMTILCTT